MPSILLDVVHRYLTERGFTVSHARDANGAWGDVTVHDNVRGRSCTIPHDEFLRAAKLGPDLMLRGLEDRLDRSSSTAIIAAIWDPSHREIL